MGQRVQLYRSTTAGSVPPSMLTGELAVNLADRKIFAGSAAGTPIDLFTGSKTTLHALLDGTAAGNRNTLAGLLDGTKTRLGGTGWLEAEIAGTETASGDGLVALSSFGNSAVVTGLRSSDSNNPGGMSFGLGAFAINNNTNAVQTVYAQYSEARRKAGAGTTQGHEICMVNQGEVYQINPWYFGATGSTLGLWLSAGRTDIASNDVTVALGIEGGQSSARFTKGIMFGYDALANTPVGPIAMGMAKGQSIAWHGVVDNGPNAFIRSDTDLTSSSTRALIFTDTGMVLRTPDGVASVSADNGLVQLTNTTVHGAFTVSAPALSTFGGALTVAGAATFNGNATFNGTTTCTTFAANSIASNGAYINGAVAILGSLQLSATAIPVFANDAAAAAGDLPVGGAYLNSSASYCLTIRRA